MQAKKAKPPVVKGNVVDHKRYAEEVLKDETYMKKPVILDSSNDEAKP
jgi:hypothetical protein